MFHIHPGDSLIVLGEESQGIAILREEDFLSMVEEVWRQIE